MKSKHRMPAWLIELIISAAVFFAVAASRGVFTEADPITVYKGLCDAFFVPGIMLICVGLLSITASQGVFDIFSYAFRFAKSLFIPFSKEEKHQRYYEYKLEKALRQKKTKPLFFLIGLAYLAASGLCLIFFNIAGG